MKATTITVLQEDAMILILTPVIMILEIIMIVAAPTPMMDILFTTEAMITTNVTHAK